MIDFLKSLMPDQRIVISAHVRPDGDAIGSSLGLMRSLRLAGLDATAVLADNKEGPAFYSWLADFDELKRPDEIAESDKIDVFILLDTPLLKRLSAALPLFERAETTVLIDHHPPIDEFTDIRLIDQKAGACAQI
ncbi:MAG: DHH family phosphoesterase, partial [Actinomycetia bacterium]|nr:DHH family phosphoesterase [Actinomycetes bacterium]